jgi:hypothetical protein
MQTTEQAPTARRGPVASLDAYAVSILGLGALLPASARLLTSSYTSRATGAVQAIAARIGPRAL